MILQSQQRLVVWSMQALGCWPRLCLQALQRRSCCLVALTETHTDDENTGGLQWCRISNRSLVEVGNNLLGVKLCHLLPQRISAGYVLKLSLFFGWSLMQWLHPLFTGWYSHIGITSKHWHRHEPFFFMCFSFLRSIRYCVLCTRQFSICWSK